MIETEHLDLRRVSPRTAGCRECTRLRAAVDTATAQPGEQAVTDAQQALDRHLRTHRP